MFPRINFVSSKFRSIVFPQFSSISDAIIELNQAHLKPNVIPPHPQNKSIQFINNANYSIQK